MGEFDHLVGIQNKKKVKITYTVDKIGEMDVSTENAPMAEATEAPPDDATFRRVAWKKVNPWCFWIEIAPGTWYKVCV